MKVKRHEYFGVIVTTLIFMMLMIGASLAVVGSERRMRRLECSVKEVFAGCCESVST